MLWLTGVLLCAAATATPHEVIIAGTGHGTFHAFTSAPQSSLALNPALNTTQTEHIEHFDRMGAGTPHPASALCGRQPGSKYARSHIRLQNSLHPRVRRHSTACNRSGVMLASARACWPLLVPTAGVLTVESAGALASTTRKSTARTFTALESTACGWPFDSCCGGSVVISAGAGPCFLTVDDQAQPQWLLIANYLAGTGAAIRILPSGQLSESPTSVIDEHS